MIKAVRECTAAVKEAGANVPLAQFDTVTPVIDTVGDTSPERDTEGDPEGSQGLLVPASEGLGVVLVVEDVEGLSDEDALPQALGV